MTTSQSAQSGSSIVLTPASWERLNEIEAVFDALQTYSKAVDGIARRAGSAREFIAARPAGCAVDKKHAFLAKSGHRTIGLLDMIADYPSPGVVFVGLLAIAECEQRRGAGRALWQEAEGFARNRLQAKTLRLAVIESNPVLGFWTKMGFHPTGEVKPFEGEARSSRAIIMEKIVDRSSPD